MSTFLGWMKEFPDIRVDYFRPHRDKRPPLVCFLSHVHSDHLTGLESFKGSFIYCSAATKNLLVNLERKANRINFAKGILEQRKQTYTKLDNLLRPLPLVTPTIIVLEPGNEIQVTLFDANHCTGAVMLLFESKTNTVLYTGDIRSEPWFVNNLTRNPLLIEYTSGMKTLDCIYLDTSNLGPMTFPTKAEGLKELLIKVKQYPPETVFHFSAWTFGYEEVWMALSRALNSDIHVDQYKERLYKSVRADTATSPYGSILTYEGPVLAGYKCGNETKKGCLTRDTNVRIHSCEKGMDCPAISDDIVWIRPIITRLPSGEEIAEIGIGGGWDDLNQSPEFDINSVLAQLLALFASIDPTRYKEAKSVLAAAQRTMGKSILKNIVFDSEADELSLQTLVQAIRKAIEDDQKAKSVSQESHMPDGSRPKQLPKTITFPYSRHSSLPELQNLVRIFKPKDVYPCTVNEEGWSERISMRTLFGHLCCAKTFRHDAEMREFQIEREEIMLSQQTQSQTPTTDSPPSSQKTTRLEFSLQIPRGTTTIEENVQGKSKIFNLMGNESPIEIGDRSSTECGFEIKKNTIGPLGNFDVMDNEITVVPTPHDTSSGPGFGSSNTALFQKETVSRYTSRVSGTNSVDRLVGDAQGQPKNYVLTDNSASIPPYKLATFNERLAAARNMSDPRSKNKAQEQSRRYTSLGSEAPPEFSFETLDATPSPRSSLAFAVTPSSASQGTRRKALQELTATDNKRLRLQFTGPGSSPSARRESEISTSLTSSADVVNLTSSPLENQEVRMRFSKAKKKSTEETSYLFRSPDKKVSDLSEQEDDEVEKGEESEETEHDKDSNDFEHDGCSPRRNMLLPSVFHDEEGHEIAHDSNNRSLYCDTWEKEQHPRTFRDSLDQVSRCGLCGHEVWAARLGFCTACMIGQTGIPYWEFLDPEAGPCPVIELNEEENEMDQELLTIHEICEPYLDCDSSAYDSQDEQEGSMFREEYEIDSFIDDESISKDDEEGEEGEEGDSSDEETDYEQKYKDMMTAHIALQFENEVLTEECVEIYDEFRDFRRAIMGSDFEGSDMGDMEETDEEPNQFDDNRMHIVDVEVPDVALDEVVLSQGRESSESAQNSEPAHALVEPNEPKADGSLGRWDLNDTTLVSAEDNHTHAEIEL